MVILLMGVSGVGKTVVGERLASRLGWTFYDADDLHPAANVAKMHAGVPLDDADRAPWLQAVHAVMEGVERRGGDAVVACSALKASYRRVLMDGLPGVRLVHLVAPREVIRERVAGRRNHFMPAALLESQLDALEPPAAALVLDAREPVDALADRIVRELGLRRE